MFCDLVGSTALSEQLDPEEWREVVQTYQRTCAEVINRFDGHIAQYLGDGLLIYFGYPTAHEDDARRAVRAGLEIIAALQKEVASPLRGEGQGEGEKRTPLLNTPHPNFLSQGEKELRTLQVRIGIHTGLVVIGDIGAGRQTEQLALGDTPNIAARLQGLAEPNTVVISAATHRLIAGFFDCHDGGLQPVKGVSTPVQIYRVLGESNAQSRLEVEVRTGRLTPLVGRSHEVGLLLERWTAAQAGDGQVVLLNGEPGIGKSRLAQEVKERLLPQEATCLEFRCSPYAQNSAFSPVLAHLQRILQFEREDAPQSKLAKLQQTLTRYHFPQADTFSLLAALLSLPHPDDAPPLTLSPQKQKQKTQEALVAWLIEEAERAPVYCIWEDLHWADPSTLELLGLLLDQVPTTRLLVLLTARPEFSPPWSSRTHLTPLNLSRLPRTQAGEMIERVTGGKSLPSEIQQQIVSKTDGVPLFVEELTKMVLESGLLREEGERYVGAHGGAPMPPLAIPTTLHDSLMARLDRLATVKEVAQLGATLGREFSYGLLQAISPLDEGILQQALAKLVEAEVLYQRGLPPQARYIFKHALIQDAAYQSLLKSRRQQYHQQIAQVLEERSPELVETQPELVAHHYTEAGLIEQAIPYWQAAGQAAARRSANGEAISHITTGLRLLKTLPESPERQQQELLLRITLGAPLIATKGYAAPEVGEVYARARTLSQQIGETPQLFLVLFGLWGFYVTRAELQTARALAEQQLRLVQRVQDPTLLLEAYSALGVSLIWLGEFVPGLSILEQGLALYDPQMHHPNVLQDPGVTYLIFAAWGLWYLGYPDQALKRSHEAIVLAQNLSHPYSLAGALLVASQVHQLRGEVQAVQERAEEALTLSTDQGFLLWLANGAYMKGWALAVQGHGEEGIAQMREGIASYRATGAEIVRPYMLGLLAQAYGSVGQVEKGLAAIGEALIAVRDGEQGMWEAEVYWLKGELTLQKGARGWRLETRPPSSQASSLQPLVSKEVAQEAEGYFLKAIEIAQRQQAKSLELRAVMSLARLWQRQSKKAEARQLLAEIYGWFTEGFDTKDLREARALLENLA